MRWSTTFKTFLILLAFSFSSKVYSAGLPSKVLVGYWHNWHQGDVPFIPLAQIDNRYNVICLSFAAASGGDVNSLAFSLWSGSSNYNASHLIADINTLRGQGKTVLMSVGGANGSFRLSNTTAKNTFVSKMKTLISSWGVDGIDIDLEQSTYVCPQSGKANINSPETHMQNLIDACKELKTWFKGQYGRDMIVTTAPETVYTSGGISPWNYCNGAFLPFIQGMGNDLDLVMVQLYNSGSMYSNKFPSSQTTYNVATPDFIITQTEILIEGFTFGSNHPNLSGTYNGIPEEKIAIALPANSCNVTAGSGYQSPTNVQNAIKYLMGTGSKPGAYTLSNSYPNLRGMMTWSINNDAEGNTSCEKSSYEYAQTFEDIFGTVVLIPNSIDNKTSAITRIFPNPAVQSLTVNTNQKGLVQIMDVTGKTVTQQTSVANSAIFDVSNLTKGIYIVKVGSSTQKFIKK